MPRRPPAQSHAEESSPHSERLPDASARPRSICSNIVSRLRAGIKRRVRSLRICHRQWMGSEFTYRPTRVFRPRAESGCRTCKIRAGARDPPEHAAGECVPLPLPKALPHRAAGSKGPTTLFRPPSFFINFQSPFFYRAKDRKCIRAAKARSPEEFDLAPQDPYSSAIGGLNRHCLNSRPIKLLHIAPFSTLV